jgi:hypothetical protein
VAYEGEVLDACGVLAIDLSEIAVVAVSGSKPNACGHLLLYSRAHGGYYFHVAGGVHAYPRYMAATNYPRYLKENGKRELRRIPLRLPNPDAAETYLEEALSAEWLWGVLPHNCVSFCEEVIRAGGGSWNSHSNCPVLATDVPQQTINQFLYDLETQIYRLYGAPR